MRTSRPHVSCTTIFHSLPIRHSVRIFAFMGFRKSKRASVVDIYHKMRFIRIFCVFLFQLTTE